MNKARQFKCINIIVKIDGRKKLTKINVFKI